MASNEDPSRHHTTPELNYQNWDSFHSPSTRKSLFSIDILLACHEDSEIFTEHGDRSVAQSAELPEKIRINSECIAQFLGKFGPSNHPKDGPILIFRPYKILVMLDQEIRRSAMNLDKRAERTPPEDSQTTLPSSTEDEVQLAQVRCLIQFMDTHLSARIKFLQSPDCHAISFSDLWLLYKPGDVVVSRNLLQAYQVIRVDNKRRSVAKNDKTIVEEESVVIHCVWVDFDGEWLGPVLKKVVMKKWALSKQIQLLELLPLMRAEAQKEQLRQHLVERGQTFVRVASVSPMHYSGHTLDSNLEVIGSIVIDIQEALRIEPRFESWKSNIENIAEVCISAAGVDEHNDEDHTNSSEDEKNPDDSFVDDIRHNKLICSQATADECGDSIPSVTMYPQLLDQVGPLTETELMLMSYRVFGFIIDTGNWVIDLTSVGKKTTAECIARMAGVPLLQLSADNNLSSSRDLFIRMERHFNLAKRWGCIVMLNNAAAILSLRRESGSYYEPPPNIPVRRAVQTMLDKFTGITFLIADHKLSNMIDISETSSKQIMSRINASLLYPNLDEDQTVRIFELNMRWTDDLISKRRLDSLRPVCLMMGEDILRFASDFYKQRQPEDRWNCRQIQTAFSTALALAHADAETSAEGETEQGPQAPLKVTLKATHFEVFARSIAKSSVHQARPVVPNAPIAPTGPRPSQHTPGSLPPRTQQRAPQQFSMQQWHPRPPQQLPDQMIPSAILVPNSGQFPPLDYRLQMLPPPPPPPPMQQLPTGVQPLENEGVGKLVTRPPQEFFLASPLSLDARPELLFLAWDAFKDARTQKDSACSAIDILVGEPVVSFDQEAQDSAWWSRWGDRKRGDGPRAKIDTNSATAQKERDSAESYPSPLPERIRIHSKYISAILEEIGVTKISTASFVLVRPFKALTYYEDKIRAKYEHADAVGNDGSLSRRELECSDGDDDSSSIKSESDDGAAVDAKSHAAFQHLACLVEFIDTIRARRQYLLSGSCSKVTFADVWHLFKPGDEVLDQEQRQAYRILSVNSSGHRTLPPWKDLDSEQLEGDEPTMILVGVYITFDGASLGSIRKTFEIASFEGEEDISSLPVLPLRLVKGPDSGASRDEAVFRQDPIDRGRMFVRMARYTPMHYNGPLLHPKEEVDSQVVIDFEQAFGFWAHSSSFTKPVVEKLIGKPIGQPLLEVPCLASCCAGEQVHEDAFAEQKWNEAYVGTLIPDPQDRTKKPSLAIYPQAIRDKTFKEAELTDDDLVIMSYKVCGFVLRTRKWAQMDLKYLSPLNSGGRATQAGKSTLPGGDGTKHPDQPAETTLDQLVLPPGHKDIVKSLISQHFQDKATGRYEAEEKDVVRGKGKGLIILLHGAPGVGKTSTAEGVAEAFNKPLFQITSGDLGTNARELEDALEWHFYLAHKWDCVLLLDEADVFLSVRSPEDFQRNSLVAVFLRVLEYYAGVLFLTTNRIGDFDEAFSSRIHISLYYPPLKRSSTKKIFDLNLRNIQQRIEERGVEIDIEHDEILGWAIDYWRSNKKMRWNGRQIRNACQTALALAEYDAQHPTESTSSEAAGQEKGTVEKMAKIRLTIGHLETVAKAYLEFMRYLHEIYGKHAERRAKAMGIRARESSIKHWAPSQELLPQEEDDDSEESDGEATGTEAAQKNKIVSKQASEQTLDSKSKPTTEASAPGPTHQNTPFPTASFPYPPFQMPNMPNPYGMPIPFGQNQQPQAAPYQQTTDQQSQYLVNMAPWNSMVAGGQQVPFPGMPGMHQLTAAAGRAAAARRFGRLAIPSRTQDWIRLRFLMGV
ncbi:hypothetical protein Daus18300_001713 [Diaporthe australafricana]|uniref:AAA+ ATPase domain-containing protein n=1 Tax=Diaporthe australafricana TaxID=127596 RepID=A0ABR3XWH0_9PEZI